MTVTITLVSADGQPSSVVLPSPTVVSNTVTTPLSWGDARFATNKNGTAGIQYTNGTISNLDWNAHPTYASGDQCFTWNGPGTFNVNKCRVDWREGPRIGCDSGVLNVDQCFINCVGKSTDHADGIQAYSPGGTGTVNITNTCFRSYSDAEAKSVYGSGFVGSDAFFWADSFGGTVNFTNVVIWGGARGVSIYADSPTSVAFDHVYFVPSPDGWEFYDYDIRSTTSKLTVIKWNEVRAATIVNGAVVPGALLPSP